MRIVHCFRSPVGGIFRHVRDLAREQARSGHEVGILCDATTGGAFEDALFDEAASYFLLGIHRIAMQRHVGPGDIAAAWRSFDLVRRLQPDVLHGHGAKGGFYARVFGTLMRRKGRPVARLYAPHGGVLHYDAATATGRAFFAMERRLERVTDHILFVSDHERQSYHAKVRVPRAPASLVYNGLREDEFEPVATAADAADLVYVGMMRDLKGPDLLIEACALMAKGGRTPRLVMVGAGDDLPRYRVQVAKLGLGGQITFLPAMPAREAFARGRILVVPSRAEAMPYIVLEALACGRPLIASAVGGIPEILGRNSPALFEPSAPSLAAKLETVLADEAALAAALPQREALRARFSASAMARDIEAIYRASL